MAGHSRTRRRAVFLAIAVTGIGLAAAAPAAAVTGGTDVAAGGLGFLARISVGDTFRACSGTLIHPQLVLTAKSCFEGADGTASTATVGGKTVAVRDVTAHPDRDLAIARLDTPVTSVAPAAIATAAPAPGDTLTIAGFGRTATEWVPSTPKAASATVGDVGDGLFDVTGAAGVCKGDAGGPSLRVTGGTVELAGVHHGSNQAGCLGEPATSATPRASDTRVDDLGPWIAANLPAFRSGLESGDPRNNWANTAVTGKGQGGVTNVGGITGTVTTPELKASTDGTPHSGSQMLLYSGMDTSATTSYAYLKAFGLGNVAVRPTSVLSYWIFPQSKATSYQHADGTNSTCVAVDLGYTDGTNLRDSLLTDQRGNRAHPKYQCGTMPLDAWTQVIVPIGAAAGKTIANVNVGYDQPANTGGYRGLIDDIQITDIVRSDRFASGLESGDPQLGWTNTVSSVKPGGGLANVDEVCCDAGGPETKLSTDGPAHGGTHMILYSGLDTSATTSYAYTKAFAPGEAYVTPASRLSYWIYPQSKATSYQHADGTNSTCVALDMILTDNVAGTSVSLRDAHVTDNRGLQLHPKQQCTHLTLDTWNYVSAPLGAVANGKQITEIDLGYDQAAGTGGYRGLIDDVRVTE